MPRLVPPDNHGDAGPSSGQEVQKGPRGADSHKEVEGHRVPVVGTGDRWGRNSMVGGYLVVVTLVVVVAAAAVDNSDSSGYKHSSPLQPVVVPCLGSCPQSIQW